MDSFEDNSTVRLLVEIFALKPVNFGDYSPK